MLNFLCSREVFRKLNYIHPSPHGVGDDGVGWGVVCLDSDKIHLDACLTPTPTPPTHLSLLSPSLSLDHVPSPEPLGLAARVAVCLCFSQLVIVLERQQYSVAEGRNTLVPRLDGPFFGFMQGEAGEVSLPHIILWHISEKCHCTVCITSFYTPFFTLWLLTRIC